MLKSILLHSISPEIMNMGGGLTLFIFTYRNALITTPGVNLVHDFDLKYLYDYNSM